MFAIATTPEASRARWLLAVAVLVAIACGWYGPIAQWADYHEFADLRPWLGIPNAANVLSNAPFAFIGAWGLWVLLRRQRVTNGVSIESPWVLFCVALIFTALGSALYHWTPDNRLLITDRLPIAWACATLLCAFLAERVNARWASPWVLALGWVLATLSVLHWVWTEHRSQGDLRAYLFVQFLPMLLIPLALGLRLKPLRSDAVPAALWWLVLGFYALAKVMEMADRWIFDATQFTSGHTLKHLLAAASAACLVHALARRGQVLDNARGHPG